MKTLSFEIFLEEPFVYCKAFLDKFGAIDIACLPKICPRTKQINVVLHHFRWYVHKVLIYAHKVFYGIPVR